MHYSDGTHVGHRVDEKVVRKMLRVNPGMRHGRTTGEVKRDMEQTGTDSRTVRGDSSKTRRHELQDALGFFLRGKRATFELALTQVREQRAALDVAEAELKTRVLADVAGFLRMLDEGVVRRHGAACLLGHEDLLRSFGVSPDEILLDARGAG